MNCQEFQLAVGAEPNSRDPEVAAHAAQCPQCARYKQELQTMDRLIYQALNVDIPAQAPPRRFWRRPAWAIAASALLTVAVAAVILIVGSQDTFARELVDHIEGERFSLVTTSETANPVELSEILQRAGVRLKPGALTVSYAQPCTFRGHLSPHLVVQTERGPVTVLVLVNEPARTTPQQLNEGGFRGVILPAPRGVIAVLGENVPVDAVAKTIGNALDYGTEGAW